MKLGFLEIFNLIAILHCFVLGSVMLWSKFFRNTTNRYLGYTLWIIAVIGFNNWFWDIDRHPLPISISDLLLWQFLYPVTLIFFFYKAKGLGGITKKMQLLFLPFLVLSLCNTVISMGAIFQWYTIPLGLKDAIAGFYKGVSLLSMIIPALSVIWSYVLVFHSKDKPSSNWLKLLWLGLGFIIIYGVVLEGHRFWFGEKQPLTFLWACSSIIIYYLIFKGIFQFKLANDQFEIRSKIKNKKEAAAITSGANPHFARLMHFLEHEKMHHDPSLSRERLAEKLGISSSHLTQIVKEHSGKNISELLNSYRVNDVRAMIKDPNYDRYSLLAIGLECGFNSKTSFYTNFKKETGLTPNQFRKQ